MAHSPLVMLEVVIVLIVIVRPPTNVLRFLRKMGLLLVVLVHIRSLLDDCHFHMDKVIGLSTENGAFSRQKLLTGEKILLVNADNRMLRVLARRMAKEGGIVIQTCLPDGEKDLCGERDEDYDDDGNARGTILPNINEIFGRNVMPSSSDTLFMENYEIYKYSLDLGNFTDIDRFVELMKKFFSEIDMIVINADTVYSEESSR